MSVPRLTRAWRVNNRRFTLGQDPFWLLRPGQVLAYDSFFDTPPMRYLALFAPLVYLCGFAFAAFRSVQEIYVATTESEPTSFTAKKFAQDYQGQQWISVAGRVALEHRFIRPSKIEVHRGKKLAYISVPVVPLDWQPTQPVHIIATFGPMPQAEVDAWSRSMAMDPSHKVQGQLRPGGFRAPASMFPDVTLGKPLVVINEGTEPNNAATMSLFLVLTVVLGWVAARRIYRLVRNPGEA